MRFLDIKTDYAFKKVFGSENSKDIDTPLQKVFDIVNTADLTKEELELQEKREEFLFIQKNSIEKAKREAKIEGREEGKQEKAIEIAKQLLKANV